MIDDDARARARQRAHEILGLPAPNVAGGFCWHLASPSDGYPMRDACSRLSTALLAADEEAAALRERAEKAERERDAAQVAVKEVATWSEAWRHAELDWQRWASNIAKTHGLAPEFGEHGDESARRVLGQCLVERDALRERVAAVEADLEMERMMVTRRSREALGAVNERDAALAAKVEAERERDIAVKVLREEQAGLPHQEEVARLNLIARTVNERDNLKRDLVEAERRLGEAVGLIEALMSFTDHVQDCGDEPDLSVSSGCDCGHDALSERAGIFLDAAPLPGDGAETVGTVHIDSKPPVTEEQSSCGGCGRHAAPWEGWQRPDKGACWWLWEPEDQMWTFLCRDEREDVSSAGPGTGETGGGR